MPATGRPGTTVTVSVSGGAHGFLGFILAAQSPGAVFTSINATTTQWLSCDASPYALASPSSAPTGVIGHTGAVVDAAGNGVPVPVAAQLQLPSAAGAVRVEGYIVKEIASNPYVHPENKKGGSVWCGARPPAARPRRAARAASVLAGVPLGLAP